jgi:hypothetical protein
MGVVQKTDEVVKREFLEQGESFFRFHGGRDLPKIMEWLEKDVKELNKVLKEASDSSTKLSTALNKLTFAAVVISAIGLCIAGGNLIVSIIELANGV